MSKTMSRRVLLGRAASASAALACPALLVGPARAAEFEFKLSTTIIPDHPLNARVKEAAAAILDQSRGRLAIEVFPGYLLGSSTSALSQLRNGSLEFLTLSGAVLSTLLPIATIYNVAFAFQGYDQVWAAMDGAMGDHVRGEIEKIGIHPLKKHWDLGFRQITTSTKPIASPDDLVNMKLRVPVAPLFLACFKALGASPAPINFDELYTALQTKVVDGQENDLFQIEFGRIFEVQKFCSMTGHIWDGYFTLVNGKVWKSLPDDLQEIVAKNFDAAAERQRADMKTKFDASRQVLQQKGIVFNEPNRAPFQEKLRQAGFYAEWKSKFGDQAWSLLEAATGKLA